jgi:hypothetical protein
VITISRLETRKAPTASENSMPNTTEEAKNAAPGVDQTTLIGFLKAKLRAMDKTP